MSDQKPVIKLAFRAPDAHRKVMGPSADTEHPLFARIYREHFAELLAFVRRRVATDAEAADIAQEAYVGLLRYREVDDLSDLRALLFRIALNTISTRLRLARAHHHLDHIPLDEAAPSLIAEEPSQDRQVAGEQQLNQLAAAVEKLPPKCRQAFVLRCFDDWSLREIAEHMNISTKAVERHITTALKRLQKRGAIDHE